MISNFLFILLSAFSSEAENVNNNNNNDDEQPAANANNILAVANADNFLAVAEPESIPEFINVTDLLLPSAENARLKFVNFFVNAYGDLCNEAYKTSKLLLKAVIADFVILNGVDTEITARVSELSEFVNKINVLEVKDSTKFFAEKLQFIMDWDELMEKFDASIKEQPNTLDLIFDISFQKNGAEILMVEFGERLLQFIKNLDWALQDFWSSLTEWEQCHELRFGAWYWQYKLQWCLKKKFLLLRRLFKIYDELNVGNNEDNVNV